MTIEESKMMWKLEVENNKPLYGSFSKEMKRLYNKVDELINEGVITYEDFTNDVIDSITTTIVDNGKSSAEPSRADTELSNKTRLCESECTNGTC